MKEPGLIASIAMYGFFGGTVGKLSSESIFSSGMWNTLFEILGYSSINDSIENTLISRLTPGVDSARYHCRNVINRD